MIQIELSDLVEHVIAELSKLEKYEVSRKGVGLGIFLPFVKPDSEQQRAERERTRRGIVWLRANDLLDAETLGKLQRSLADLPSAGTADAAEPVATTAARSSLGNGAVRPYDRSPEIQDDRPLSSPEPRSGVEAQFLARLTPKSIDSRDLLTLTDDEIRTGPSLIVRRNGETIGHFVPSKPRPDPEEMKREWAKLDRLIDAAERHGYTREQLAEDLDVSKPFRDVL